MVHSEQSFSHERDTKRGIAAVPPVKCYLRFAYPAPARAHEHDIINLIPKEIAPLENSSYVSSSASVLPHS